MHCKSYSHFFSKKIQHIYVSLDVNFNESLTNDVVSFEQLGPGLYRGILLYISYISMKNIITLWYSLQVPHGGMRKILCGYHLLSGDALTYEALPWDNVFFRHMGTEKAQNSMHYPAVLSGPLRFAYRIIGYCQIYPGTSS